MKVDADDLRTNKTDDRGRIYLGTEYANKRVTVAVIEVESDRRPAHQEAIAIHVSGHRLVEIRIPMFGSRNRSSRQHEITDLVADA